MGKWNPLNMKLRCWVISQVLRLEQTSSEALKAMFRVFKDDPKTLGNKSSALSFKSKIDLLYDLEELTKEEYNHLLKIMEIRNQFAHNANATSFSELDNINPSINKYLKKYTPKEIPKGTNDEQVLQLIFADLFKKTVGKLLVIELEYRNGIVKEMGQVLNDSIVKNLDKIWKKAYEMKKDNEIGFSPFNSFMINNYGKDIDEFQNFI